MPITVLMNSFRIGVIGVLVEYWGTSMAEGFLHDFEGWLVFMTCVGLLFLEMALLTKLTRKGDGLKEVFWPHRPTLDTTGKRWEPKTQTAVAMSVAIVAITAGSTALMGSRAEITPERAHFATFPTQLDAWRGQREAMDRKFVDILKFDDYVLANYHHKDDSVNFYVAYYASQRKGQSAHSPRSCIPGGGWEIQDISPLEIDGVQFHGQAARANRVEIQKGRHRQLVYYWFQQRGRVITSEYEVKMRLLLDSIQLNRTDGALVRLTTVIRAGESWEVGDRRLTEFMQSLSGQLDAYVPS
jgi:exosortase D (VPLPA-CTERM-specific)